MATRLHVGVNGVLPGGVIGILGGGQLGRMIAIPARQMGFGVAVLTPEGDSPAGGLADHIFRASFDDLDAARRLAAVSDVVTYEFENVPAATASAVETMGKLRPSAELLRLTQDRNVEHDFLHSLGISTAAGVRLSTASELDGALHQLGLPARLKSALGGYDGGGQIRLFDNASVEDARTAIPGAIGGWRLEAEVNFEREISVVLARGADGRIEAYPPFENVHKGGILHVSTWPAKGSPKALTRAVEAASSIAESVQLVGVMCTEFFVIGDDVIVNELAPRVHNSGHLTIEGANVSQFEQHVRAVCGLPLVSPMVRVGGVAMVNLLGTHERRRVRVRGAEIALAEPGVALHVYGKERERPRRKMGHVTVCADTPEEARSQALFFADRLRFVAA